MSTKIESLFEVIGPMDKATPSDRPNINDGRYYQIKGEAVFVPRGDKQCQK